MQDNTHSPNHHASALPSNKNFMSNLRHKMKKFFFSAFTASLFLSGCGTGTDSGNTTTTENKKEAAAIPYTLIKFFPHDTTAFTEGLLLHEGKLFESTGSPESLPWARSVIGAIDTATGKLAVKAELDRTRHFGEGIAFLNGKVYQLTYQSGVGFIYDAATFKLLNEFTLPTEEGWGMTTDGKSLVMSDGTNTLTWLDPVTLQPLKKLEVSENGYAADNLNELEYINGYIYANSWKTNYIYRIDPVSGNITGKLDLSALAEEAGKLNPQSLELNGIAFDSISQTVYVTGKLWPRIYALKLDL